MNLLKRSPITAFFVLAWSIRITMNITSIDVAPLKLLAEFGPAIAALIVTVAVNGKVGVRALLGRVGQWRVNPWWYVLVLFGPAALQLVSIGLFVLLGGPGVQFQFPGLVVLPIMLTIGMLLSLGEEIGWRGFAFPRLQSSSNPVVASLIIGALWAFWHVPGDITNLELLSLPSTYIGFLWFLGLTMTGSVLMGWVYNRTGGSILLMALFHVGLTVLWQFVTLPEKMGQFDPSELSLVLMVIVVVIVVLLTGTKKTARDQQTREQISPVPLVEARESSS